MIAINDVEEFCETTSCRAWNTAIREWTGTDNDSQPSFRVSGPHKRDVAVALAFALSTGQTFLHFTYEVQLCEMFYRR